MAELYNRPIEIRIPGKDVLRICDVENDKAAKPVRLSYHNKNHYNSIRDPNDKTVGLGLGLPANQKPTTDKTLVAEAVEQSLKSDAEKQVLDTVKLESAQQDLDEELLKAQAIEESELMDVEDQIIEHELGDDEYYAQQLNKRWTSRKWRQPSECLSLKLMKPQDALHLKSHQPSSSLNITSSSPCDTTT